MAIISFINQKGGCGKSTGTCHLAWWLVNKGHSVTVIDADAQQSVSRWLKRMDSPIECNTIRDPEELLEKIPDLGSKFDFVLVDGAGGLSESTRCILLRSDVVIIPVQPTGLDLSSGNDAIRTVKQVQSIRSGVPDLYIFLSRAVKGTKLREEALQFFNDEPLLKTVIHQRQPVADCFGQAAVVWTLPRTKGMREACEEFEAFCEEIIGKVGKVAEVRDNA